MSINDAIELLADITLGEPITRENLYHIRSDVIQARESFTFSEYPQSIHLKRLAAIKVMEKWLTGDPAPTKPDTPRTNAALFHRDNGMHRDHPLVVTDDFALELERERDEAREAADKWEKIAHDKLSEVCRQIEKKRFVTEQRDRLAEALSHTVRRINDYEEYEAGNRPYPPDVKEALNFANSVLQSLTPNAKLSHEEGGKEQQ